MLLKEDQKDRIFMMFKYKIKIIIIPSLGLVSFFSQSFLFLLIGLIFFGFFDWMVQGQLQMIRILLEVIIQILGNEFTRLFVNLFLFGFLFLLGKFC
jgi:hypothetical protein